MRFCQKPLQGTKRQASQHHRLGSAHSSRCHHHHSWSHTASGEVQITKGLELGGVIQIDTQHSRYLAETSIELFSAGPVKNALKSLEKRLSQETSGKFLFLSGTGRPPQSACHACPLQELLAVRDMARHGVAGSRGAACLISGSTV